MAGAGEGIEDDLSISNDALFLRRIPPTRIVKAPRPDSSNFEERDPTGGLSVTLWEAEQHLHDTVAEKPVFGVVRVTAGELRAAGYLIVRRPLPDNPNHCECYGKPSTTRKRELSIGAKWVKLPDGADPAIFGPLDTLPA